MWTGTARPVLRPVSEVCKLNVVITKRTAIATFGIVSVVALGMAGWAACSVPAVHVANDTEATVRLMGCASVGALHPNESREIRPEFPCLVFSEGGTYLGCLDFPDSALLSHETVAVSALQTRIERDECARSDDYNRLTWIRQHRP